MVKVVADSVEEVKTEEKSADTVDPDTVDADARLAVLPEDSVVDEVEDPTEED